MKNIKILPHVTLMILLFFNFTLCAHAISMERIVNDYDFLSDGADGAWSYGTYQANNESYTKWENETFRLHVIDDTNNDEFGWGYLHQGVQPHNWGTTEPPLKENFTISLTDYAKPNTWFFDIQLKRSNITWLDVEISSIPNWLKNLGGVGTFAIGLDFHFETSNANYSAPIENSTILSFEVQFSRIMWNGNNEIIWGDDFFYRNPPYDYDVHNIFVPNGSFQEYINPSTQMAVNRDYEYVVDCGALLSYAWDRKPELFPVNQCTLKYVNFYVETLNCGCDVKVDSIDVYYEYQEAINWLSTFNYIIWILIAIVICALLYTIKRVRDLKMKKEQFKNKKFGVEFYTLDLQDKRLTSLLEVVKKLRKLRIET